MMGQWGKMAWLGLILAALALVGFGVYSIHDAGYNSGYAQGESSGKESGYKDGKKAGAAEKEWEIKDQLAESSEQTRKEIQEKQDKIDRASIDLEVMRKERDGFKTQLDKQIPKVNTVYIEKTVEGKYEEKPVPPSVYTADFVRLWNQAIFGQSGVPDNLGKSDGGSPGWRGIDGRTAMKLTSQDLLQNFTDNMSKCHANRDTLTQLQRALRDAGIGVH